MMKIEVPFYLNNSEGSQCFQVCMKSVLKHYLNKDFSLKKLDALTGRKNNYWTWTFQIIPALDRLGLKIKYFSGHSMEPFLKGKDFFIKHFGTDDGRKILRKTDLPVFMNALNQMLGSTLFEKKCLDLSQIKDFINKGSIPLVVLDNNIIHGINHPYAGHMVTVTGYDKENIYYHDSGPQKPEKHKAVNHKLFTKAAHMGKKFEDIIIVYGKKRIRET